MVGSIAIAIVYSVSFIGELAALFRFEKPLARAALFESPHPSRLTNKETAPALPEPHSWHSVQFQRDAGFAAVAGAGFAAPATADFEAIAFGFQKSASAFIVASST